MDIKKELLQLLDETLHLDGRTRNFSEKTRLLGSLPEMDSMGVVSLLTAFEDKLGFSVEDNEIEGSVFATVGSLLDFVRLKKLARSGD